MAGSFTDFLEDELLDHAFRNTSYTPAATVYVGLFTTATGDAGGGTEVSGGSYARTAITFAAASSGSITNSGAVTFPTATASWSTISHFGIMDASTVGNMLCWGNFDASKAIDNGDTAKINASALTISLD